MSGLVRSARVGGGRDREGDFSGDTLVLRFIGDSMTEGYGASLEYASGLRPWCIKYLESYRGNVRVVGTKGYGDSFWGTTTWGSFYFRFSWWEQDGMSGEKIGYELPTISATSSSDTLTTSTPHGMSAGALFRWVDPPSPFVDNALYLVESAPTTTTFKLKASSAGSAVAATESGSFSAVTGIISLPRLLAAAAPVRETVITFPGVGTNDINTLINSGSTAAAAATETHRRLRLLIEECLVAWPDSDQLILFGGLAPVQPGSASGAAWATKQQAVELYRPLLESEIDDRGSRFGYRNIWAGISPADNIGDGIHVTTPGFRGAGIELGKFIREKTRNAVSGRAWPRSITKRERAPKLALTGTTGRVTGPSTTIGSSTFLVAVSHKPDTGDLPADSTTRFMVWLGSSDYSTGFGIATRNTTGVAARAGMSIYLGSTLLQSAGIGPYYNYDSGVNGHKVLREGDWNDWVILFNAESLRCVVWRDGELMNNTSVSAWNIAANTWKIGHISTPLPAAEGHYQDFELAVGSHLTVAAVSEYARARYAERARFPGTVDFRRLNEGTVTSAASTIYQQAAATLSGGATWVDADSSIAPWEN